MEEMEEAHISMYLKTKTPSTSKKSLLDAGDGLIR